MGETIKSLVGKNNSVALAIAGMGPEQRRAYIHGLYMNDREFTRDEYAAIKAAEAMDNLPGQWQSYGTTGRRGNDRQIPDSVVEAYRKAYHDGVTKVPVAGTDDWVYITERSAPGVAAAPGGSVLAGVLSQGAPASARMAPANGAGKRTSYPARLKTYAINEGGDMALEDAEAVTGIPPQVNRFTPADLANMPPVLRAAAIQEMAADREATIRRKRMSGYNGPNMGK